MSDDEGWEVLSGCNACINSIVCKELGNCVLLTINKKSPTFTKAKRRLISRVRTGIGERNVKQFVEEYCKEKPVKEKVVAPEHKLSYRSWDGPLKLTRLEQMFINELNKPR